MRASATAAGIGAAAMRDFAWVFRGSAESAASTDVQFACGVSLNGRQRRPGRQALGHLREPDRRDRCRG